MKCGPEGDIYAIYSGNPSAELRDSPIRRVSVSSQRVTEYPVPAIPGYEKLARISFDVAADGTLYELLRAHPQSRSPSDSKAKYAYLIVKFKEDGTLDTYFSLGEVRGQQVRPRSLAVFADGNSLVFGTSNEKGAHDDPSEGFAAILDATGRFRAPVTLYEPATADASKASAEAKGPLARELTSSQLSFGSPNGNSYVFRGGHLAVVSETGSVYHDFKLAPPSDELSPMQMAAAGAGYFFIAYDYFATGAPGENAQSRVMISVANAETGEVTAVYRMAHGETDFALSSCAVSTRDFVLLGSDDQNHLEVVHYVPN